MKKLRDILYKAGSTSIKGNADIEIAGLSTDSREIKKGWLFVAVPGVQVDGHNYIPQAIKNGARAIVCETMPKEHVDELTYVLVPNARKAFAFITNNFFDDPSADLKLIGVTGTNGKSTVATLLYRLFTRMGYFCGLLSTIEYRIGDKVLAASHTTPDPLQLQSLLSQMREAGCAFVFMEVSSHALDQDRVAALQFDLGIFTNISHDHLDYHGSFKNYIKAKKLFFDQLSTQAFALYNADDKNGQIMMQNTSAQVKSYAVKTPSDFQCRILENTFQGLFLNIEGKELHSPFVGEFSAYNITACYAAASLLGLDEEEALMALSALSNVPGRFERVPSRLNKIGIVDYAHTPDALQNILETITSVRADGQKIITVVGCGGERDKAKRPLMAEIGAAFSDKLILTSDNPRSEDPELIIEEMFSGIPLQNRRKVLKVSSREDAIKTAGMLASSGDIVLVAGKGHEITQDVKGIKTPFDDRIVLKAALD